MRHLLCFGCGYSSTYTALNLLGSGKWKVTGTTRTSASREILEKHGISGVIWPGTPLDEALKTSTHWLVSIPPRQNGEIVLDYLEHTQCEHFANLKWIGYFSTTAVYGDHGGGWVEESTPVNPTTTRGKLRVQAENAWYEFANRLNIPLFTFRLAGIYGPDRGPMEQLRKGNRRKIVKPDHCFNRIHAEDIAGVVCKAILNPDSHGIFNLCDDLPERADRVIDFAADLMGIPKPRGIRFEEAELSEMARSFYSESKKVRNQKIKSALKYELTYPTFKEGLRMQRNTLSQEP